MEINSTIQDINNAGGLQQAVGIELLNKVKDVQASEVSQLLQDFAQSQAPHPTLGKKLDISI